MFGKRKYLMFAAALIVAAALGAAVGSPAGAQNRLSDKKAGAAEGNGRITVEQHRSSMMRFIVEGDDTVYVGQLPAARVFARVKKQHGKDWRQYYRLVYNFSKVYPYAKVARKLVMEADSTIEAGNFNRAKKEKYINIMQDRLFAAFETPLRNLTISQGALLMRLIDREVGKSPYLIIKDYKNGIAAGFWQGVAKLFGTDMKAPYDPEDTDIETEELVQIWERGEFDAVYFSLFGVYPDSPEIPAEYL